MGLRENLYRLGSGGMLLGVLLSVSLGAAAGEAATEPAGANTPAMATHADTPSTEAAADGEAQVVQAASQPNEAAQLFQRKCTGCHTIGRGALSGPDLKPVANWPRPDLETAIIRMEKSVGPLSEAEVDRLTEFLLQPDAAEQLAQEQERVAMQQAATLEPPSPEKGRALFWGERRFVHGGMACSACHVASGPGGNLAASLTDAGTRLGETSLMSTIESPGFPIMRAIYANHPVTKQEATHLVAYLDDVAQEPTQQAATIPLHAIGLLGAVVFMAGVGFVYRRGPSGTRARLVASSRNKTRRGAA